MAVATTTDEGRVRFRLRVGVTGHRDPCDPDAVATALADTLAALRERFTPTDGTEVTFEILSALAEGADRLVVQVAQSAIEGVDLQLHAVLPLPVDDYVRDFATEASQVEFDELLAQNARQTTMPPAETREEAYELAGRYIVDHSDVVIAVWDRGASGGRGGTTAIVEYADRHSVAVIVVAASRRSRPAPPPGSGRAGHTADTGPTAADEAYARLVEFNRGSVSTPPVDRQIAAERVRLHRAAGDSDLQPQLDTVLDWALPRFVRADDLAMRYQRQHYRFGMWLYLSAALAVTAVAAQALGRWDRRMALIEIGFMLVLLTVYVLSRRHHVHDRWLGYRSLAEAFRSALFVAMVTAAPADEGTPPPDWRDQPWFQRSFSEAWAERPPVSPDPATADPLWRFVVHGWIEDQLAYHTRAAARLRRAHRRLNAAVLTLFVLTVLVGLVHVLDVFEGEVSPDLLVFLAVTLPAFGAALTGIRDQHQYLVHGERSRRTKRRLEELARRDPQGDLSAVQRFVAEVQAAVEAERSDWWTVSEFQSVEMAT